MSPPVLSGILNESVPVRAAAAPAFLPAVPYSTLATSACFFIGLASGTFLGGVGCGLTRGGGVGGVILGGFGAKFIHLITLPFYF